MNIQIKGGSALSDTGEQVLRIVVTREMKEDSVRYSYMAVQDV